MSSVSLQDKSMNILYSHVAHGVLGVNGSLGYENMPCSLPCEFESWNVLSAHATSELLVEVNHPVEIQGMMDGSSHLLREKRGILVAVNGDVIDELFGAWDRSCSLILSTGRHHLMFDAADDNQYAHTLWLWRDAKKKLATLDNTVFLSSCAFGRHTNEVTHVFRHSALRYRIPVIFVDNRWEFVNYYEHKILHMRQELLRQKKLGKKYAFIMDCRDIFFIHQVETILAKFNAMYADEPIFNVDPPGESWPIERPWFWWEVQRLKQHHASSLNSGFIAGEIDRILVIMEHARKIHKEFTDGTPRHAIHRRIFSEHGNNLIDIDQFCYQMVLAEHPEWFAFDRDKKLCVYLREYPTKAVSFADDPRRIDVTCKASIIHGSMPAWNPRWRSWAEDFMKDMDKPAVRTRAQQVIRLFSQTSPEAVPLEGLEVNVSYACNLKCRQCTHLGNILQGVEPLDHIVTWYESWSPKIIPFEIRILGGEPLLHPDLPQILRETRKHWNHSNVVLVTNGLLLDKTGEELFQALREIGASVLVSKHFDDPEYNRIFSVAMEILNQNEIPILVRRSDEFWFQCYRTNENDDILPFASDPEIAWNHCYTRHHCITLMHNCLYKCPQLACFSHAYRQGDLSEAWRGVLDYQPLSSACTRSDILDFLREIPCQQCGICPETMEILDNCEKRIVRHA